MSHEKAVGLKSYAVGRGRLLSACADKDEERQVPSVSPQGEVLLG